MVARMTAFALGLLLTASCGPSGPEYVYVPAAEFEQVMEVSIDRPEPAVRTSQWLTVRAERRSGPWARVRREEAGDSHACMRAIPPMVAEFDIEAKVAWHAEPSEGVEFQLSGRDFRREVRFARPGRYRIWATSTGCGPSFDSAPIEVEVTG